MPNQRLGGGIAAPSVGTRNFYLLVLLALINLATAILVVSSALGRMQASAEEIIYRAKVISVANQILSIARDSETGQRGYLLTGNDRYLQPYRGALHTAPGAWLSFDELTLDPAQTKRRQDIRVAFNRKIAHNVETITQYRAGDRVGAISLVQTGRGKDLMDRIRVLVGAFEVHENNALKAAERRSENAWRLAIILTVVGGIAFVGSGALMYAAVRRARTDAGAQAIRASIADQRFKATFDQAGVGFMHIDRDGYPVRVNDAMCDMTGYSRQDFLTASKGAPAYPANLFSSKARCDALLSGEVDSYRHERVTHTKDGREIFLVTVVSSIRGDDGEISFLSAIISDQTEQHVAERRLRDSQERLRRLQDEFAHVARVNDLGEMAAAIAHEVNQPLTAINNYMSVASRLSAQLPADNDLPLIVKRASEQALRAGQIIKRMRAFVERSEEVREVERVGSLIDSATELTMIGSDRTAVDVVRSGNADGALVLVDAIQFQQALIILMRNAIEAFSTAQCPGKCRIEISTAAAPAADAVVIEVSDNGPGLGIELAKEVFKPFVTTKPGNMGMGLSIARRLIESHGGQLTMADKQADGATFRITFPLVQGDLNQAA